MTRLRPARIEDVPIPELSGLSLAGATMLDTPARRRSFCLSDQSRRIVAAELPLQTATPRARAGMRWDLRVPERNGEPDGKPEGLAVLADGTFVVGLDTETPQANLCWYPR